MTYGTVLHCSLCGLAIGVFANLAGAEDEAVGDDRLVEDRARRRRLVSANGDFRHGGFLLVRDATRRSLKDNDL